MAARELRLALAALLLVAPALLAAAHGPPLQRQFDPLTLGFALWLGPAGLVLEAPAEAAVPMAGAPGGAAPPLDFQLDVPVRTSLLGGIAAHLVVRADGLVLPRAPGNALLQLEALRGGEPVEGTAEEVAAPATPLQPGASYALDAATGSFPEPLAVGDAVGVRVTFVGTAAGGGLSLLLGPEASRANLTARVAGLDDLGHEHAGWRHLRAQDFGEAERLVDVPVLDLELHHGSPDQTAAQVPAGEARLVRIDNAESPEQAVAHGPWGLDAPHVVRFAGAGIDERLSVYPGEVVLRTLTFAQAGLVEVRCEAACNRTGLFTTITVLGPQENATDRSTQGAVVDLEPGRLFEVNLQLAQGETLRWSFATDPPRPLRYDVHSHDGNRVVKHAEGERAAANGTFVAPAAGVYSLLLENDQGETAHVTYRTEGGVPYTAPPASKVPLPSGLLLAALPAALLLRRRP